MSALLERLRAICGPAHVLTHDDPATDLSAWEQDWRKRSRGRAPVSYTHLTLPTTSRV